MTEPIAVDVPPKPAGGVPPKPAPGPPAPAPAAKPAAKPAPPTAAGVPTLLQRFARNKFGIAAAAVFSLAAGVAGVRLLVPGEDPDAPTDTAAQSPEAKQPDAPGSRPGPSIIQEPTPPPETIPPAGLPIGPAGGVPAAPPAITAEPATPPPPASGVPAAPPTVLPVMPGVPTTGAVPPPPPAGAAPAIPPATGEGFGAPKTPAPTGGAGDVPPAGPEDLSGGFPLIPAAGVQPPRKDAEPPKKDVVPPVVPKQDGTLPAPPKLDTPALPALPGSPNLDTPPAPKLEVPGAPKLEVPGAPKLDPVPLPKPDAGAVPPAPPVTGGIALPMPKDKEPEKKEPEKKVQGEPVRPATPPPPAAGGPIPVAPAPTGGAGGVPPVPPDFGAPTPPAKLPDTPAKLADPPAKPVDPPAKLPDTPAGGGGTRIEFTKPAGAAAVTPAPTDRQPATTYDEDIYTAKANDTWEAISREFYGDTRYARALSEYNQGRLGQGGRVNVPPIHIVKRYLPASPTPPAGGGRGTGSAPDWGAPAARPAADRPFVIPTGGMSMRGVARAVLGSEQRWGEIYNLNPHLKPDDILPAGTELKLPPAR